MQGQIEAEIPKQVRMQDMELSTRNNGTANPTHGRMAKNTMHRKSN